MREDAGLGKQNINKSEDVIVPRVGLQAAISKAVTDGKCAAGNFYHNLLELDLGDTLNIVIIHHSKYFALWAPRHEGGGILARASDGVHWDRPNQTFKVKPDKGRPRYEVEWATGETVGKSVGLGMWGTSDPANEDSPPAATLTHRLICVDLDRPDMGPFQVLLARTGEGVAKTLLSKIELDRAPIFGQKYTMSKKVDTNGADEYYQYTFTKAGHVQSMEEYSEFKKMYESFNDLYVQGKLAGDDSLDETQTGEQTSDSGAAANPNARNDY